MNLASPETLRSRGHAVLLIVRIGSQNPSRQESNPGQRASSADACRSLSRLPARGEMVARFLTGSLNCLRAIGIGLLSPFIYQRHGLKRAVRPRPAPRKSSDVGRFGYNPHYIKYAELVYYHVAVAHEACPKLGIRWSY